MKGRNAWAIGLAVGAGVGLAAVIVRCPSSCPATVNESWEPAHGIRVVTPEPAVGVALDWSAEVGRPAPGSYAYRRMHDWRSDSGLAESSRR